MAMQVDMGRIIGDIAQAHAGNTALINIERGRRFTFAQMHELTNRMSNMLMARFGLGDGDTYAIILENEHVGLFHPWMFKCPAAGVWLDIRESRAEKLAQLDYVGPKVAFLEKDFLDELVEPLQERGIAVICMDPPDDPREGVHSFWELVEQASPVDVHAEVAYDDSDRHLAVMRFTGGTTGQAKCARYSLANFWAWGMNPAHYIHTVPFDRPRTMLFSPVNHAASGSVVIPTFLKGGCLVTMNKADIDRIGWAIQEEGIELIYTVPTVLYRMLDHGLPAKYRLGSLKSVRYGGAPISPSKLEALLAEFGPVFVQGYGSTECWPSCTILAKEEHRTGTPEEVARLASIGRPFPGQEILVCDEMGNELPAGERGELYIRGANTIQGYHNAPELNRQHFTPGGFWKSGDVGYRDADGYIYLVDRKKDMIITGGYNVYATEVENCLNSHPAVANSAVVGVPDENWGEAVSAVVVLRPGQSAEAAELIAHCKANLARHKAPKRLSIVPDLPLSAAGKVLRREVRAQLMEDPES